ncbi:MAG: hypothetical protein WCP22_01465 [Chlamydiota bacterium]
MKIDSVALDGLPASPHSVFACGADMKSRFSFFADGRLHQSEDHGDLSDPPRLSCFLSDARAMCDGLGIAPGIVAHDMHPAYYSRLAADLFPGSRRVAVQHHHAHVAAALAGGSGRNEVIGIAFDGTGYGTDGALWGGEFLAVSPRGWKRCGHLGYLRMPGGDAAAREPWRMGLSLLHSVMGNAAFDAAVPFDLPAGAAGPALAAMLDRGVFSPLTSSCGRLFDAVAAILGIARETQAEAEAAMELERRAAASDDGGEYPFEISGGGDGFEAGYGGFVRAMTADIGRGVPAEVVARRFHNGLSALIVRGAEEIRRARGCAFAALCGGVFGNRLLRETASRMLREAGFTLVDTPFVPANDLGICAGQTWVALHGDE